ncbi:glycosyltransferase 1 domain-containing protein 1-like [Mya arenaria]|uniref:glycosyltransferase 1 domain-containing protein 1-like n=1 Tax=Mya arenaria TaxID=6604 RepID=UPI0022E48FBD|nr:glycosyltransferase 1 domain-containing protein 1-like [Mya arenaria]XP_052801724.1 glycosyltransferase 1 domain-containing protein 1-like [Mya arenaria]XP_052801725.1 glycosyltransferase 1 domain-containing protein 1-like [Mya arenaria]XP_052801726.1 glycosyltransferase 1 domain-containing protein 1-like [Mya arenaria]
MDVRVLLLSPLNKRSGNLATIQRIRHELEAGGLDCVLSGPDHPPGGGDWNDYIRDAGISVAVGIHAFKCGIVLKDLSCPYILIVGGTDVNGAPENGCQEDVMTQAVRGAGPVVAFSEAMADACRQRWAYLEEERLSVIPQGVEVLPRSTFRIKHYIRENVLSIPAHCPQNPLPVMMKFEEFLAQPIESLQLITWVGGIRAVKDPLFVMEPFAKWRLATKRMNCYMVLIGSKLDEPYFQRFYAALSRCPGVVYVGGLDHEDAQAAVSVSKALVNSSVSEGMALSLLEAMALGTPVLARKIPGNAAIVEDGTTGFLFDTAEEFSSKLETIFVDAEARKSVTSRARAYVTEKHSLEAEQAAYVRLVHKALNNFRVMSS